MTVEPLPALLLLGPTGAGKTPLGEMLQSRGLPGRPCLHFDFGANLREVVARNEPDDLISRQDIEFLRGVLKSGALLEDEHFPLAERILRSFLTRHHAGSPLKKGTGSELTSENPAKNTGREVPVPLFQRAAGRNTWIVLNGLPRHVGQAERIEDILQVRAVVRLACPAETVLQRIAHDTGGDRSSRQDDDLPAVRRKLQIFEQRTAPLVEHYRRRGVSVETIEVTVAMTPEQMVDALADRCVTISTGAICGV